MKRAVTVLVLGLFLTGCTSQPAQPPATPTPEPTPTPTPSQSIQPAPTPAPKVETMPVGQWFSREGNNNAFRHIKVRKDGPAVYTVNGQARVFEAAFCYDVENGHDVLTQGNVMASIGAPNWGNFTIQIKAQPPENGALTLILWEANPKDGSRKSELPILLERTAP